MGYRNEYRKPVISIDRPIFYSLHAWCGRSGTLFRAYEPSRPEPNNPHSYGEDRFSAPLEVNFRRGTRTCRAMRRISRLWFWSNLRAGHHRRRAVHDMVAVI